MEDCRMGASNAAEKGKAKLEHFGSRIGPNTHPTKSPVYKALQTREDSICTTSDDYCHHLKTERRKD
ncbi:hypothetical protein Tco_1439333 [Tanacetum coccineum]